MAYRRAIQSYWRYSLIKAINTQHYYVARCRIFTETLFSKRSFFKRINAGSQSGADAHETVLIGNKRVRAVPYAAVFDASLIYW